MLLSMTGYGASQLTENGVSVSVELRTVNNRYLKLHSRLSEGYSVLESRMEETIRKYVRRGAVQLNVDVRRSARSDDLKVNEEYLNFYVERLVSLEKQLAKQAMDARVDPSNILALPGVISDERRAVDEAESDWPLIERALVAALESLTEMRKTEGQAMTVDLLSQVSNIRSCGDTVERLAPEVVDAYQTRLTERINKLLQQFGSEVKPTDVVREVGVFAERVDISEEVVRLRSHLDQFEKIMASSETATGRKLEFLVQELLRETNTIGSKANNAEIAKSVVDAKTNIERIREMVQNVE